MGVLADIIVANRDEAAAINAAGGDHLRQWDCLESKGIDTIKLGTLSQILANRSPDDVDTVVKFMTGDLLDQSSDDGPWIYLVPDSLRDALAALDEDTEESVASKWARTEEFQLDRWLDEDVNEYLHDLVLRARKARETGKSLLLWMSL